MEWHGGRLWRRGKACYGRGAKQKPLESKHHLNRGTNVDAANCDLSICRHRSEHFFPVILERLHRNDGAVADQHHAAEFNSGSPGEDFRFMSGILNRFFNSLIASAGIVGDSKGNVLDNIASDVGECVDDCACLVDIANGNPQDVTGAITDQDAFIGL